MYNGKANMMHPCHVAKLMQHIRATQCRANTTQQSAKEETKLSSSQDVIDKTNKTTGCCVQYTAAPRCPLASCCCQPCYPAIATVHVTTAEYIEAVCHDHILRMQYVDSTEPCFCPSTPPSWRLETHADSVQWVKAMNENMTPDWQKLYTCTYVTRTRAMHNDLHINQPGRLSRHGNTGRQAALPCHKQHPQNAGTITSKDDPTQHQKSHRAWSSCSLT